MPDSIPASSAAADRQTWPTVLAPLIGGQDLSTTQTAWAMQQILGGNATESQIAAFVVALRAKGETVEELTGLADTMLSFATAIQAPTDSVDIVGSGGDRTNAVNVSTMAALVTAAAGTTVVKHGNRGASTACGSADVIEELGVTLDLSPEQQIRVIAAAGIGFLFARSYHPALRYAAVTRSELGVPTVFNFLGPLTNPARPVAHSVGVSHPRLAEQTAGVLASRGSRGLVFHGRDRLDKVTTTTTSTVWLITDGRVDRTEFDPLELDIARATTAELAGGTAAHNADVVRRVAAGEPGPVTDIVALNAAAALLSYAGAEHGVDLASQLRPHLETARTVIADGAMAAKLEQWVAACDAVVS